MQPRAAAIGQLAVDRLQQRGEVQATYFALTGAAVNLVKSGMASSINQIYWCYVGAFFIIAFIGYKFQGKQIDKAEAKKK